MRECGKIILCTRDGAVLSSQNYEEATCCHRYDSIGSMTVPKFEFPRLFTLETAPISDVSILQCTVVVMGIY